MEEIQLPKPGYVPRSHIKKAVLAFRQYIKKAGKPKKDLFETSEKVMVEVVFKNIPSNSKTYVHTIVLPNHPRLVDDTEIALFVRHKPPQNESEKIQFARDRDLDLANTRSYYKKMLEKKLEEPIRSKISKIISLKELATEYNTFQKLNKLAGAYDLFLSDYQLMANKMNPLPRRLGRRFWVKEKKVPLMVKLDKKNLNERFEKVLKTEPFYILGRSATEHVQVGIISQSDKHVVENIEAFLNRLYELYGSGVRLIRLKTISGLGLPLFADLDPACPEVKLNKNK